MIQAFESFGIIDEVNFKDDKYAICTFQKDSDASYAVKNYKGGWRVKMSSKGAGGGGVPKLTSRVTKREYRQYCASPGAKINFKYNT